MTNWIRKCHLTIGSDDNIDVSGMRIKFIVFRHTLQTPNASWFRIYNLSKDTNNKIIQAVSKQATVKLEAGYESDFGPIFQGKTVYGVTGRESPTDTYVDVYCYDGGDATSRATVNHTFPANTSQKDKVDYLMQQLQPFGVDQGTIKGLSETPDPQPETMYGSVFQYLRQIAQSNGQKLYIDNGSVNMMPTNAQGSAGTIQLGVATGLIGMPQVTPQGIIVTALISPKYNLNVTLTIDPSQINQLAIPPTLQGILQAQSNPNLLGISDGEYVIESIEWRGDTRGEEWYAIMYCHGLYHGGVNTDYLPRNMSGG